MPDRVYEIRVSGLVSSQDLDDELRDVQVAEHEYRTVLRGRFRDQAALYGCLHRLRAYGLEVVEVRRVLATVADDVDDLHAAGDLRAADAPGQGPEEAEDAADGGGR